MPTSFKQEVVNNPGLLVPKEDMYVNRKLYTWGETSLNDVDLSQIHEFYDLMSHRFFYKLATPFDSSSPQPSVFKRIDTEKDYDVEIIMNDLRTRDDYVLFKISYPNKYFGFNTLLMLVDKDEYNTMDDLEKEHYLTINSYINLVLRKCETRTWKELKSYPALSDHTLNWVWFRKPGFKFPPHCLKRAESWIRLNLEMSFTLWTDMENEDELLEFLSECPEEHAHHFTSGRVKIMYHKDTVEFVKLYLESHKDKEQIKKFNGTLFLEMVENRDNSRVLIAKTDFLRAMVLHHYGGFYADFNDCECFLPIKYWFHELVRKQQLILPCDTFNETHISNFFLYVPKGSKMFKNLHLDTLAGFEGILKCFKDDTTPNKISSLYLNYAKKFVRKLKQAETYEPTQLLVDTMYPAYVNGRFLSIIRNALTDLAVKGLERSDMRAKVFFPLYVLKYIAKRDNDAKLMEIFDYFVEEFKQIGNIGLQRQPINMNSNGQIQRQAPQSTNKFEVQYFQKAYVEDFDLLDDFLKKADGILERIDGLEGDVEYDTFMYNQFIRNMAAIPMVLTNFVLHLPKELTFRELIPFSFIYINMTHVSMIGHYGDGSSLDGQAEK